MSITKFPSGVSSFGVPLIGSGPIITTGSIFFVDSATGSNGNTGASPDRPLATIDYAVGLCTANKGDYIICMPNHSETITTDSAIDLDVHGITLYGVGRGTNQPRIDFNHADATVEVNADDVSIINMNFHSNITSVTIGLSVIAGATNLLVSNCLFDVETTTTDEFLIAINFGVGCNNFIIEDIVMDMGLGGAATGIKLVGATAGGTIRRSRIVGDYSQACIAGITTLSTEIYIEDNLLANGASGNVGAVEVVEMLTGTTGVIRRNHSLANVATIAAHYVADTMAFYENYATEDVGQAAAAVLRSGAVSVTASADD